MTRKPRPQRLPSKTHPDYWNLRETYNKCDDCCPVLSCHVCGEDTAPSEHDHRVIDLNDDSEWREEWRRPDDEP